MGELGVWVLSQNLQAEREVIGVYRSRQEAERAAFYANDRDPDGSTTIQCYPIMTNECPAAHYNGRPYASARKMKDEKSGS